MSVRMRTASGTLQATDGVRSRSGHDDAAGSARLLRSPSSSGRPLRLAHCVRDPPPQRSWGGVAHAADEPPSLSYRATSQPLPDLVGEVPSEARRRGAASVGRCPTQVVQHNRRPGLPENG